MDDCESLRKKSLRGRIKFVFKDSMLYGGFTAVNKLLSLITLPILTRAFSTSEYGVVDAISIFGGLFTLLVTMGQDSAVARYFYETDDRRERKEILSQALLMELVLCVVVCCVLFLGADYFVEKLIAAPQYASSFRILILSIPFLVVLNFSRNIFKWTFERAAFVLLSIGSTAVTILMTVFFVVVYKTGVKGVFYAQLFGTAVFALIGAIIMRRHLVFIRKLNYCSRLIQFGLPYMITAVVGSLIPSLDRIFITHFMGLDAMGLYAVGYKVAYFMMLPIMAFQTAWGPFSFAIYKEDNVVETYNKVFSYYTAGISIVAYLLIASAGPLVALLASSRYVAGSIVILPLVFGLVAESISWVTGIGIDLSKKTHFSALSYFIGIIASGFAIWTLIRPFGILGVAYGVMTGRIVQSITYTLFAYKAYHLRMAVWMPLSVLGFTLFLGTLIQLIPQSTFIHICILRAVLFVFLVLYIWFMIISSDEKRLILRKCRLAS